MKPSQLELIAKHLKKEMHAAEAARVSGLDAKRLCVEAHTNALRFIGMVVNSNKTELLFLSRNKLYRDKVLTIEVEGSSIESKPHIKALGTIFSNDLSWSKHVDQAIRKSNFIIKQIRFLSKWLDRKDLLQLVMSQYFLVVFTLHLFGLAASIGRP